MTMDDRTPTPPRTRSTAAAGPCGSPLDDVRSVEGRPGTRVCEVTIRYPSAPARASRKSDWSEESAALTVAGEGPRVLAALVLDLFDAVSCQRVASRAAHRLPYGQPSGRRRVRHRVRHGG